MLILLQSSIKLSINAPLINRPIYALHVDEKFVLAFLILGLAPVPPLKPLGGQMMIDPDRLVSHSGR